MLQPAYSGAWRAGPAGAHTGLIPGLSCSPLILWETPRSSPAEQAGKEKSPPSSTSELSHVVEVRRLELLTPYMRSKCSTS